MSLLDRLFPDLLGMAGLPTSRRNNRGEEARIEAFSADQVAKLHSRWAAKIAATVAKQAKDGDPDWLAPALDSYLRRASRCRAKIGNKDLAKLADKAREKGQQAITRASDKLDLPVSDGWEAAMRGHNRDVANTHRRAFGDDNRLYFPLPDAKDQPTGQQMAICTWLTREGYKDIDYTDGKATAADGTRLRIGKALSSRPDLLRAYSDDPGRAADKLMVVISRDPVDIARMSTGRGWISCMDAKDGEYADYLPREIAGGTIIAYLAKQSDPDLHDPLGRMLIKPHLEQMYRTVAMIPDNVYGIGHPGLVDVAWNFARTRFSVSDIPGQYDLARGLYNDNHNPTRVVLPRGKLDAEDVLRALMVPFHRDDQNRLVVNGGVDLSNMGLTELPDFSGAIINGYFNCAGNRLTSLKGAPAEVSLFINCARNRLRTLEGLPKLGRWLDCSHNQLVTLKGCPETLQGTLNASNNPLITLEGSPRHINHDLVLSDTLLDNWDGAPLTVGLDVHACRTAIRTQDGAPKAGMKVNIDHQQPPKQDTPPVPR